MHLYTLGKAVIGTGGLANADEHALQIMHLLNVGVLANMERDSTTEVFAKFLAKECKFQRE